MRAITAEEIEQIAGGLAKRHPNFKTLTQTLSTINVTAPRPGPPDSGIIMPIPGGGGGGAPMPGGGGGGGGGGAGSHSTSEQEWENAVKAAIEEAELGVLHNDVAGEIFTSVDWANLAADVNSTQFQYGIDDYNEFERTDGGEHYPAGYGEIVKWGNVNWHAYDEGGTATAPEAIANLFHDINVNHHVAIDPAGPG